MMFALNSVTGIAGAEVVGIDIGADLDDGTVEKLTAAFSEHKVLFFRDQSLTPDSQLAFARRFGPLEPMAFALDGYSEIMELKDAGTARPMSETWHTDSSFKERPPMATVLRAVDVPPFGRDTVWADMCAAYEALSSKMQRFVEGLRARHDVLKLASGSDSIDPTVARQKNPVVEHPVVRVHPVTGHKSLYVNQMYTTEIVDMRPDESRHVLDFLFAQTRFPEHHIRFSWRKGDVAIWDNRSTQHYIVHDRAYPRVMHRVSIGGDRPIGTGDALPPEVRVS